MALKKKKEEGLLSLRRKVAGREAACPKGEELKRQKEGKVVRSSVEGTSSEKEPGNKRKSGGPAEKKKKPSKPTGKKKGPPRKGIPRKGSVARKKGGIPQDKGGNIEIGLWIR